MLDAETLTSSPDLDPARDLLVAARQALKSGDLVLAAEAFGSAASGFTGPQSLLGGALAWRGLAEVAMTQSRWNDAVAALDQAERLFAVARDQEEAVGRPKPLRRALQSGFAACRLARGDVFLRQGEMELARRLLVEAARLYGTMEGPAIELWRMMARLAEHEGRWNAARMAWSRVEVGCRGEEDPGGEADAAIRRTEVLLLLDDQAGAAVALTVAEKAARSSMDGTLLGRVRMAGASLAQGSGSFELAYERWQGAIESLEHAGANLRGLARVRMALVAAKVRPLEVAFLLKEGMRLLLEAPHPDALGLVHHQLAAAAIALGRPGLAVLAAAGAERARGRGHPHTQALLVEAFESLPQPVGFDDLARAEGLIERDLGTRRGAMHLCDRLSSRSSPAPAVARRRSQSPKLVWKEGDQIREESVPDGMVTMGSVADADIQLPTEAGVRLSIRSDGAGVRIHVDPHSPLPVLLDGHAVRGEHFLTDGDVLTLGELELTHVVPPPQRSMPSLPPPERAPPAILSSPAPDPAADEEEEEEESHRGAYGVLFVVAVGAASAGFGIAGGAMLVLMVLASIE